MAVPPHYASYALVPVLAFNDDGTITIMIPGPDGFAPKINAERLIFLSKEDINKANCAHCSRIRFKKDKPQPPTPAGKVEIMEASQ